MSTFNRTGTYRIFNAAALVLSVTVLTACASIRSIADIPEYFDHNSTSGSSNKEYITNIDLARIRLGMSQLQVKNRLGPPMLKGNQQDDRWEYVLKKGQGAEEEFVRYAVYFKDQKVVRLAPLTPAPATIVDKAAKPTVASGAPVTMPASTSGKKLDVPEPTASDLAAATAINDMLSAWAKAWSTKDIKSYLSFYADTFEHGKRSREIWEKQRQTRLSEAGSISVTLSDLLIDMQSEALATVKFKQEYKSNRSKDKGRKVLILSKFGGSWKIQKEDFQK